MLPKVLFPEKDFVQRLLARLCAKVLWRGALARVVFETESVRL